MDLQEIDAAINGAKDRWGHADAQHNEDMLALIAAAEAMREKLYGPDGYDPMPVFVIKGKDRLALEAIAAYGDLCVANDLGDQASEVEAALLEVHDWQHRHPELVKAPDHPHVPVADRAETSKDRPVYPTFTTYGEKQAVLSRLPTTGDQPDA